MTDPRDPTAFDELMGEQSPEEGARANRSKAMREIVLAGVVLFLIFGVFLPQFIDYGQVFDSMLQLSIGEIAVLAALGLARTWFDAGVYNTLIPGLGWWSGWKAWAASNSVAFIAPPGADLAIRFGMYRTAGIEGEAAGAGIVLSWFFTTGYKLALPVIALVTFVIWEDPQDEALVTITLIGAAALLGGVGLIALILYRDTVALRVGTTSGRWYNGLIGGRWKFPEAVDAGTKLVDFRSQTIGTLGSRWIPALATTLMSQAIFFAMLVMSLRFVGVTAEQASISVIFDAYAVGLLLSMIPIFPGGIGVVELAYVAVIVGNASSNPDLANAVTAGAFIHRIFTWLLPIVVGLIPLAEWRREMVRRKESGGDSAATMSGDG